MELATHQQDFYTWTQQQASLLRARDFQAVDLENIIEELEDMGRSQYDQLESRLIQLFKHLLKWSYQPEFRGSSWERTIREQRRMIPHHLKKHPGLKGRLPSILVDAYALGREGAADETNLPLATFPEESPWSYDQVLDNQFWPE